MVNDGSDRGKTMIDRTTGGLHLDDEATCIAPGLARDAFLASSLGARAEVWVRNEPHCAYRAQVRLGGKRVVLVLRFQGEDLRGVELALAGDRWGTSWDDWSEALEGEKQRAHDAWLRDHLGPPPYDYAWGTVESCYDERSGASTIVVRYQAAGLRGIARRLRDLM